MRPTFLSAIFWCCLSGNARGEIEQQALQHPTHALLPILSPFLCVILPPHAPPPRHRSLSFVLTPSLSLSGPFPHSPVARRCSYLSPCLLCCKVSDSQCNDPTGCSNCSASVLPRCTRPALCSSSCLAVLGASSRNCGPSEVHGYCLLVLQTSRLQ